MKAVDRRALGDRVSGAFDRLRFTMQVIADGEMDPQYNLRSVEEFIEDVNHIMDITLTLYKELGLEVEEDESED